MGPFIEFICRCRRPPSARTFSVALTPGFPVASDEWPSSRISQLSSVELLITNGVNRFLALFLTGPASSVEVLRPVANVL
jgi:hypothetical protein